MTSQKQQENAFSDKVKGGTIDWASPYNHPSDFYNRGFLIPKDLVLKTDYHSEEFPEGSGKYRSVTKSQRVLNDGTLVPWTSEDMANY